MIIFFDKIINRLLKDDYIIEYNHKIYKSTNKAMIIEFINKRQLKKIKIIQKYIFSDTLYDYNLIYSNIVKYLNKDIINILIVYIDVIDYIY